MRRPIKAAAALLLLASLAACGGGEAGTQGAVTDGTTPSSLTPEQVATAATAGPGTTSTTAFPADAMNTCDLVQGVGPDRLLNAPPTAGPIHGTPSKSRGSCEIRSESTHLRIAQFPLEELDDQAKGFADAKPCAPVEGQLDWPERCTQSPTGGFLAPFDQATGIQVVSVKASGSGLKPMAGNVNAKGVIVVSGVETAKAQRSAGVLLGLL